MGGCRRWRDGLRTADVERNSWSGSGSFSLGRPFEGRRGRGLGRLLLRDAESLAGDEGESVCVESTHVDEIWYRS